MPISPKIPTTGPTCCVDGCDNRGALHLFTGVVHDNETVSEVAQYTGGTFCTWEHLWIGAAEAVKNWASKPDLLSIPVHASREVTDAAD